MRGAEAQVGLHAHAGAAGGSARDGAGARAAVLGIGVDAQLDGVSAGVSRARPAQLMGSPAAMRNSLMMSVPISSVTGCSTCTRVFIS